MKKLLLAAVAAATIGAPAQAATIYGIDEFDNLVTFDSANPTAYTSTVALTGLTDTLKAIDFRRANGALYGLTADRVLVTINTSTGVVTSIGGPLAIEGTEFGFDFNDSIDRLRIVSNLNDNYVVNPNDGSIQLVATDVSYGNGNDPDITGSAYTTSVLGGTTQLYGIDSRNDLLVRQNNNAGTLTVVGSLGTNVGARDSFDIGPSGAFLQDGRRFYTVNLDTGRLTLVGQGPDSLYGIAAAVPEPATWAMMIGGFGLVGGALRSQRRRTAALA